MSILRSLLPLGVSAVVVVVGCGGGAFTTAEGDAGGDATPGSEAGPDAIAPEGGSVDATPPPGDAIAADAPADPSLACGAGTRCDRLTQTCCYNSTSTQDAKCLGQLDCTSHGGTAIHCQNSNECLGSDVCCVARAANGGGFFSVCKTMCAQGEGALCDPSKPLSNKCPATALCSNNQIDTWGLPSTFATCGGTKS